MIAGITDPSCYSEESWAMNLLLESNQVPWDKLVRRLVLLRRLCPEMGDRELLAEMKLHNYLDLSSAVKTARRTIARKLNRLAVLDTAL